MSLLIQSFALGMAFSALLLSAYYYVVLKPQPDNEVQKSVPKKAYNWAKDNRHGAFKGNLL